jgi:hypothetical protein
MFSKIVFILLMTFSIGFAKTLKLGETITPFSLLDQFNKVHQVNSKDYKILIVAFEKDIAVMLNDYLKEQPDSYLSDHGAVFISDIHEMPSFVTKMFAMPKMQKYKYPLLLIYDESNIFPKHDEALTVLKTKNNEIVEINFIKDENFIKTIFQ